MRTTQLRREGIIGFGIFQILSGFSALLTCDILSAQDQHLLLQQTFRKGSQLLLEISTIATPECSNSGLIVVIQQARSDPANEVHILFVSAFGFYLAPVLAREEILYSGIGGR